MTAPQTIDRLTSLIRTVLGAALLGSASVPAGAGQGVEILEGTCARHIAAAEREHGIPAGLLSSIALAESGRWRDEHAATIAWPWTVMAEGRGRYFPTRENAVAEVEALTAKGVENIDLGCMQVNMFYHGDAFASLDAALDPARNVAYAADFLARLKASHGSWVQAVGHYHSANKEYNRPYMLRVFTYWVEVRKTLAAAPAPRPRANPSAPAPEAETASMPGARVQAPGGIAATPEVRRTRFAEWVAGRLGQPGPGS